MALVSPRGFLMQQQPYPLGRFHTELEQLEPRFAAALAALGHHAADLSDIAEAPGHGMAALWNGCKVALRRPDSASGTASVLDIEGSPAWLIPFADRLRPDAAPDEICAWTSLAVEGNQHRVIRANHQTHCMSRRRIERNLVVYPRRQLKRLVTTVQSP